MCNVKPYVGFSSMELREFLKDCKIVDSFVGPEYKEKYQSVIQEIQEQRSRQKRKAEQAYNEVISN